LISLPAQINFIFNLKSIAEVNLFILRKLIVLIIIRQIIFNYLSYLADLTCGSILYFILRTNLVFESKYFLSAKIQQFIISMNLFQFIYFQSTYLKLVHLSYHLTTCFQCLIK